MKHLFFSCLFWLTLFSELNLAPEIQNPGSEKKFVVCIASYNNEKYYLRNLESVFGQKYSNYRVIYVDDCSKDPTYDLVSDYISKNNLGKKIDLRRRGSNQGAMKNYYQMIHSCEDDEIIVMVDGDDWFAHKNVLERLNRAYSHPDVWVTYGRYETFPDKWLCPFRAVDKSYLRKGTHRKKSFRWNHLRTFYASLFKKIPKDRFLDKKNQFFKVGWDVPIMLNLIDLSTDHVYYISEVLYCYNVETPINDHKLYRKEQARVDREVRSQIPLQIVSNLEDK